MLNRLTKRIRHDYRSLRAMFHRLGYDSTQIVASASQKSLLAQLQILFERDPVGYHRKMNSFGFRNFSQFEEDGLLLFIFAAIGFCSKKVVEICAGDGTECMATNLIVHHQFDGLLFDGDPENVRRGHDFFQRSRDTWYLPPKFREAWITAENIDQLLLENSFEGEIDLLSLDIDGNDYWVWKAIGAVQPRVCVIETNNVIPSGLSLTIPYDPEFRCSCDSPPDEVFYGASLLAMKNLCELKGYRLIGSHRYGFNAIFLRHDVGVGVFPEVEITRVHGDSLTNQKQRNTWPLVEGYPWVRV